MRDVSYLRAQRAYDAQLPECGSRMDNCPDCEGDGKVMDDGAPDAVPVTCSRCGGSGEVNLTNESSERRESALEDRADQERDEKRSL